MARPERALILLAAGASTRLGTPKGLYPVGGEPWLTHQLRALEKAGVSRPIVVLGYDRERYLAAFPKLAAMSVVNPSPEQGPFSSLQCGIRALPPEAGRVFVLPIDVPVASLQVFSALEQALVGEVVAALPEVAGKGGHPLLVATDWARSLLRLSPADLQARLDCQLHALAPQSVARVSVRDVRVTMNLNTTADFAPNLLLENASPVPQD